MDQFGIGLHRLFGIEDGLENLVLDLDQIDGLLGDVDRLGRDSGDGLAEMTHDVLGDDVLVDDVQPELVVEVVTGEDGVNTLQRLGFRGVDAQDPRARVRAALDLRVQHAGQEQVAGVQRVAGELAGRLHARMADADRLHLGHRRDVKHISAPLSRRTSDWPDASRTASMIC